MSYSLYNVRCCCLVVGAGTAGCVLASRLSEDPRVNVLLLESGVEGINRDVVGMPATSFDHHRTNIDWKYKSEPQKICCQSFDNQVCLSQAVQLTSFIYSYSFNKHILDKTQDGYKKIKHTK